MFMTRDLPPLTFSFGFLEAPLEEVHDAFLLWAASFSPTVASRPLTGNLWSILESLCPLTIPPVKYSLISTGSDWVALFDNGAQGGEPTPVVSSLSMRLKTRGIAVSHVSQEQYRIFGATVFTLLGPERTEWLNFERSVGILNDGKWKFIDQGSVQPFELPERYGARRVRDRFGPDLLERYAAHFGIKLFDETFYGPQGKLIEVSRAVRIGPLSLSEAQQRMGVQPLTPPR